MKRLMVLGISGSIGTQTLDIVMQHPESFEIVGASVFQNVDFIKELLSRVNIPYVGLKEKNEELEVMFPDTKFFYGEQGLCEMCSLDVYDVMINALVGISGLLPTLTAIVHKKDVALANKETLVVGGDLVSEAVRENGVNLYPIDSEHSAIFQCLRGNDSKEVKRLIITASGGAFRHLTREELKDVTVEKALHHPTWKMGRKVTIDSATMMNKGFEVIEAHHLFGIDYDQIDVLQHSESIVHSMVEYKDHSVIAQLSDPDMRVAIQYALSYPERFRNDVTKPLALEEIGALHFAKLDFERYPLLELAYYVGKKGGNLGAVLNGADEVAFELFVEGKISFLDIETTIINTVKAAAFIEKPSLTELFKSNQWARNYAYQLWSE